MLETIQFIERFSNQVERYYLVQGTNKDEQFEVFFKKKENRSVAWTLKKKVDAGDESPNLVEGSGAELVKAAEENKVDMDSLFDQLQGSVKTMFYRANQLTEEARRLLGEVESDLVITQFDEFFESLSAAVADTLKSDSGKETTSNLRIVSDSLPS